MSLSRRESLFALAAMAAGAVIGYLAVNLHLRVAIVLVALPLLVWSAFRTWPPVIALGVALPFPFAIAGSGAGLNIAASDLLLTLMFAVMVVESSLPGRSGAGGSTGRDDGLWTALRPLVMPLAPYIAWMLVLAAAHLDLVTVVQSGQRLELFFFPAVIGVVLARRGLELGLLKAYVLTMTGFAAAYPFFSTEAGGLGVQKNPAGGFIAGALLLLIAVQPLWGRYLLAAPVLTLGLLWTQSRGAIVSVVVGLAVLLAVHKGRERWRFVALMVPVAAVAAGAFALLPQQAQQRNTSFDVGTGSAAAYSLEIREQFRREAWQMIHAEPVFGTGIGRYVDGVDGIHPTTVDPHQVLLLQAAEGGYPLAACFVLLVAGSAAAVIRRGRTTPAGPAAVALLAAALAHGMVDVYWVRGTPVLGWLMIGVAIGQVSLTRTGRPAQKAPTALEGATA